MFFQYFMLPLELECCKRRNARSDSVKVPSYLELKEVLNLAPETMADEDMCKEVIKEGEGHFFKMLSLAFLSLTHI